MFLFRPPVEKMEEFVLGLPLNGVKLFRTKDYLRKIERELANYDRLTRTKNKLAKCEFCKAVLNKQNLLRHAKKCPVQIGLLEIEPEREKEMAKEKKDKKINIPEEKYATLGASYSAVNGGNRPRNKDELAVNLSCNVLTEENHRCLKYLRRLYCTK
jgi:hypothetical protein